MPVFKELGLEEHVCDINAPGMNITLLFQFLNPTKNRCCLSIPHNRHQLRYHGNADALEKCFLLQLKHIIWWGRIADPNMSFRTYFNLYVMSKSRM